MSQTAESIPDPQCCTLCGVAFVIPPEPATDWERGCMRPVTRLNTLERLGYRRVDGMPLSRYLCGRCYHGLVVPAMEGRIV